MRELPDQKVQMSHPRLLRDQKNKSSKQYTHFDRIARGLAGILGPALKVKAVRGNSRFNDLVLSCGLIDNGPATMPNPVSTKACPLDPALDPSKGISFLA